LWQVGVLSRSIAGIHVYNSVVVIEKAMVHKPFRCNLGDEWV
jgi:hypothetical protein